MKDWTVEELRQLVGGWNPRLKRMAGPSRRDSALLELLRRGVL